MTVLQHFDAYSLKARVFPGIVCLIILGGVLFFFFEKNIFSDLPTSTGWISVVAISTAFLVLVAMIMQSAGKFVVERLMFKGKENMPTVQYLTTDNSKLAPMLKEKVVAAIERKQSVVISQLMAKHAGDEAALKLDVEHCVSCIRDETREDPLLKRENIQYGFWRNLSGGLALLILGVLIILLVIGLSWAGMIPVGVLFLFLLASLRVTYLTAHQYAKRLFEVYGRG
jgi:hypothetical protein